MPSRDEPLALEQLLYGWSEANLFGRRGFGVVAASSGWLRLLQGDDGMLGPVTSYPEPGRRGAHPPRHGGFTTLRGTPVLFRRLDSGSDALDRPGNYTVQVLFSPQEPLDAGTAAAVLAGDWLDSPLPATAGPQLPVLALPRPGPRRGGSASGVMCAAVLQALGERLRLVIDAPEEPSGRAAVCDAVRRLPEGLGDSMTFSTLEADPERSGFDIAVAVTGWAPPGQASGRVGQRVDLVSGAGLHDTYRRWGEALAAEPVTALRGLAVPVSVADLGRRLDALAVLRANPQELTPEQLLSVLASPEGQAWAGERQAPAIARTIMTGMDPALGEQFAKVAQRRPAVTALLNRVGRQLLSGSGAAASSSGAERMLLGLGAPRAEIDMELIASFSGDTLPPEKAAAYLRLVRDRPGRGTLADDPTAGKIVWEPAVMAQNPALWFEAVLGKAKYRGQRATRAVVERLRGPSIDAALTAARDGGLSEQQIAGRLWAVLPQQREEKTAFLRRIAESGDLGLAIVFEAILGQPTFDPAVRRDLLAEFWPNLVHHLQLPGYLATALEPRRSGPTLSQRGRVAASVALLVVLAGAVFAGVQWLV